MLDSDDKRWYDVRLEVDAENNAQTIFYALQELRKYADNFKSRWISELIQNAKDACIPDGKVEILLKITNDSVIFNHNGKPFTDKQIGHLIEHGTTKIGEEETTGKFGTGFLKTHLLSNRVEIKGILDSGECFDFLLERDGATPLDVKARMDESWKRFIKSLTSDKNEPKSPHITEFVYSGLTKTGKDFAEFGITILKKSVPFVLLFNKKIESIELDYYGEKTKWKISQPFIKEDDFELNEIQIFTGANEKSSIWIALLRRNEVTVAFELVKQGDNFYAVIDNNLPKLFADFPLTESNDFPSTMFINSSLFDTTPERTGIDLVDSSESTELSNKKLIEDAFLASVDLFRESIKRNWKNLQVLCPRGIVPAKGWIKSEPWLQEQLLNTVGNLMPIEIVTSKTSRISIKDSIFPYEQKKENVESMWDILSMVIEFQDKLPSHDSVVHWATLIDEWRQLPDSETLSVNTINIQGLAYLISSWGSIQEIESKLIFPESNSLLFCNDELIDISNLAAKLQNAQDSLSQYLREQLSEETQQILSEYLKSSQIYSEASEAVRSALVNELNNQLQNETLYNEQRFSHITLTDEIQRLIEQNPRDEKLIRLNRKLLEEAYPQEITKSELTATLIWLKSFIELCINSNNISLFNKYRILPNENGKLKLLNELRMVESLDEILKDIGTNLGEDIREKILHSSIDNEENRLELPVEDIKTVILAILSQLKNHAISKYNESTYREANVDLLLFLVNREHFNYIEDNYPILSLAESLDSSRPIPSFSKGRKILSPVSQWDEKAREYKDVIPPEFVLSNEYDKRFTNENYNYLEKNQLLTSKLVFLEKRILSLDQLKSLLSEGQLDDNAENQVEHKSQEIIVSNLLYLKEIYSDIRKSKPKARRFLKFILEYALYVDDKWEIVQEVKCQCKSVSGHKIYPSEWFRYLKTNAWIPVGKGSQSTPSPAAIAELLRDEESLINLLQNEKPHKFLSRLGVSLSDTAKFMIFGDEATRLKMDEAMGSLGLKTRGNPEQLQEIAELVSIDPKFFEIIDERKKNLENVRANQRVGNAIEDIIREMLKNEFQDILKVSKVRVGRDVVIEEDYIENDEEVLMKIEAPKFEYSVEIKSTKANVVRMTLPQAVLSSEQGERFFLCVYPNKGEEITDELIKTNSRFISNIGKLLKPKLKQINAYTSIREDVAEKDEGIEIDLGENKIHLKINEKLWQDAISFDKFVELLKQNLLKN